MGKKIFIGVAWPYVNGELHIGHLAGYLVPADIFARFNRFIGNDVLMVSGSDCHGTPITVEAEKKNVSPQKIVQIYHPQHKKIFKLYNISFDIYTKTTTRNHKKIVQQFFLTLLRKGYLFKTKMPQYFSLEENRFLPDRYVEGTCPNCGFTQARGDQCDECGLTIEEGGLINPKSKLSGKPVTLKETEHYFFDLPKFQSFLKNYVKEKGKFWREWVYKETIGWLNKGLKPRSITRDITWGIKLPVNEIPQNLRLDNIQNKRIYVWFEAVIGYFSASIEWAKKQGNLKKYEEFWYDEKSEHYYFMGKDNLVFHTIIWPAELYGVDPKLKLPDFPIINNFINLEGKQFSKSRGHTIPAKYFGETYGVDTARFYFALIQPEEKDFDFTWEHFVNTNNGIIVDVLGNFINRTLNLAKRVKDFKEEDVEKEVCGKTEEFIQQSKECLEKVRLKDYAWGLIDFARFGNIYLERNSPWKYDVQTLNYKKPVTNALFMILALNLCLEPLIPQTNKKLSKMLNVKIEKWPEKPLEFLVSLLKNVKIGNIQALFRKLDFSIVEKERAKLSGIQKQ
jgi:methionyl-tRNA synthetase